MQPYEAEAAYSVSDKESRSTWARLIAQVYEVDPLVCPRCSAPMRILAVITEPEEVRKILRHLVKIGRSPPGFDAVPLRWAELQALVGTSWAPGKNVPFDPVATAEASRAGLRVVAAAGRNIENFKRILAGKDFEGTVVGPE